MKKVLVIEDAVDLRSDVLEMLTLEGFKAIGAKDGVEGVAQAKAHRPDLIVCDIMMPELDGYGVLEALRAEPNTATIPFIFLTAKTDRLDMRQGMVLGADDYLTKPFLVPELLDSIKSQLKKREEFNARAQARLQDLRENIMTALPHELRTPLNTIIGFSEMLTSECQRLKPDQVADWSQHINSAALRLYRLFENYLYFARVEAVMRLPEEVDKLYQSTVEHPEDIITMHAHHKAQQTEREDDLSLDIAPVEKVRGTDKDLGKIVEELVDNALKFSMPGQAVHVKTTAENGLYTLVVSDKGRGMSQEQYEAIGAYMQFERWLHEQQGAGLGLAIVKRLAEVYHATLDFDSEPNRGTTVSVGFQLGE